MGGERESFFSKMSELLFDLMFVKIIHDRKQFVCFPCRAISDFAAIKAKYGAGNCHLLQINSKRAGQTAGELDEMTNMPDPWRLYVKQSSSTNRQQQPSPQTIPKKEISVTDSLSNLSEAIDQELSIQRN